MMFACNISLISFLIIWRFFFERRYKYHVLLTYILLDPDSWLQMLIYFQWTRLTIAFFARLSGYQCRWCLDFDWPFVFVGATHHVFFHHKTIVNYFVVIVHVVIVVVVVIVVDAFLKLLYRKALCLEVLQSGEWLLVFCCTYGHYCKVCHSACNLCWKIRLFHFWKIVVFLMFIVKNLARAVDMDYVIEFFYRVFMTFFALFLRVSMAWKNSLILFCL